MRRYHTVSQQELWKTAFTSTYLELYEQEFSEDLDRLQCEDVIRATSVQAGSRILDAGCGQGRHLKNFLRMGYDAIGLDYSTEMLAFAKERGIPEFRLKQGDIRNIPDLPMFDLVVCLYTAFGFSVDPHDDLVCLDSFLRKLRPGGRLLLETIHADGPVKHWPERSAVRLKSGKLAHEHNEYDESTGTLRQKVLIAKDFSSSLGEADRTFQTHTHTHIHTQTHTRTHTYTHVHIHTHTHTHTQGWMVMPCMCL